MTCGENNKSKQVYDQCEGVIFGFHAECIYFKIDEVMQNETQH